MSSYPLQGKRILNTRAMAQIFETESMIHARQAISIAFPCLEMQVMPINIRDGLIKLDTFSDILFTSANGVSAVANTLQQPLSERFQSHRIAAVGEHTALALQHYGITAHIIPDNASQQGLFEAYQQHGLPNSLLFFRAEEGNGLLSDSLQEKAVSVCTIHAYRSVCPTTDSKPIQHMLEQNQIDAALLGSPKVAKHYLQRIGELKLANRPILIAISPQVAHAADKLGLNVQLIAKQTNFASMLDALSNHYLQRSTSNDVTT